MCQHFRTGKKMVKCAFPSLSIILIVIIIGCGEYEIEDRTNPYDPVYLENQWGKRVKGAKLLTTDGKSNYPSWSHDEKKIAYSSYLEDVEGWRICVRDITDGSPEVLEPAENHKWETSPRWSPVESRIAYIHNNYDISVRDYPGNESKQLTQGGICKEGAIVWSPDGTRIACIQEGKIRILDSYSGHSEDELDPGDLKPIEEFSHISDWSPDGRKLMVISGEQQAYIVDIKQKSEEPLLTGGEDLCWEAVWSTDVSKPGILYVTFHNNRYELWIMNADGKQKAAILTDDISHYANFMRCISWSADESKVLFVGSDRFHGSSRNICLMEMD